jgi:23S rRNA (uracil1939-C5)-methyltransferase
VTLVESSPSAAADARVNLADRQARVVRGDAARWRGKRAAAVVADPPRTGLGRQGVAAVRASQAERLVLVSCDAAALGRDAKLLADAGYDLRHATLVDLFPHTSHLEVVTRFDKR